MPDRGLRSVPASGLLRGSVRHHGPAQRCVNTSHRPLRLWAESLYRWHHFWRPAPGSDPAAPWRLSAPSSPQGLRQAGSLFLATARDHHPHQQLPGSAGAYRESAGSVRSRSGPRASLFQPAASPHPAWRTLPWSQMGESTKSALNSMSSRPHPATPCAGNLHPCLRQDSERVKRQSSPEQLTFFPPPEPMSLSSATPAIQPGPRAPQHSNPISNASFASAELQPIGSSMTKQSLNPCALAQDRL